MKRKRATADEQHAFSWYWRRYMAWLQRPGVRAAIKRRVHKRERREGRADARKRLEEM